MEISRHVSGELSRVCARDQGTNLRIMIRRYVLALPVASLKLRGIGFPKSLQERFALSAQFLLEFACAIAIAARPRFGPIFVTAVPSRMGIFDVYQFEILFPIWSFFGEGRIAETCFDPGGDAIGAQTGLLHIINVFLARD